MALNIKNAEVVQLAAEVAELANESKTEAIRRARRPEAAPHDPQGESQQERPARIAASEPDLAAPAGRPPHLEERTRKDSGVRASGCLVTGAAVDSRHLG